MQYEIHDHQKSLLQPVLWTSLQDCALGPSYPLRTLLPVILDQSLDDFPLLIALSRSFPDSFSKANSLEMNALRLFYYYPYLIQSYVNVWATPHPIHWQFKQLSRSLPESHDFWWIQHLPEWSIQSVGMSCCCFPPFQRSFFCPTVPVLLIHFHETTLDL